MSMLGDLMGPSDPKPEETPSGNTCATCKKPMPSPSPQEPSDAAKSFASKFRNLKPRLRGDGS